MFERCIHNEMVGRFRVSVHSDIDDDILPHGHYAKINKVLLPTDEISERLC